MNFPSKVRSMGSLLLPSTDFDYARAVGDGTGSSIIMACALWLARVFPEAPLRVRQTDSEGQTQIVPNHPLQLLLEKPNQFYTGVTLWMATLIDFLINGNAYWILLENMLGQPLEAWYVPQYMIEPKWDDNNPTVFISYYSYKPDPLKNPIKLDPDMVMHFRYGIDPNNTRKGLSPIASILREVFTDNEAANFSAAILKNLGIPGVIISPADTDGEANSDDLEEVKEVFNRRFKGDKRGEPMVMRTKTDVKILSFSPQQLDLRTLRRLPEERVTAVLGIPAVVVGFGAGLDRSTFANFAEAREAAYESFIAPLQRLIAAEISLKLLSKFEYFNPPQPVGAQKADLTGPSEIAGTVVTEAYFDTSQVRILQEDTSRKSKYLTEQFEGGLISRYEGRLSLGRKATDADKVYRISKNVIEVPSDQGGVPYLDQLLSAGGGAFGNDAGGQGNGPTGGKPNPKKPAGSAGKTPPGSSGKSEVLESE